MDWRRRLMRPTWVEIDEEAVSENVREIRRLIGPGRKIIACLKANAYGHGSGRLARVIAESGADILAVGNLEEAVRLRLQGITMPVLVFGNSLPDAASTFLEHNLIPTVYDLETARALSALASRECTVYVKIETGLGRLGVVAEGACAFIASVLELPSLRVGGVYTHFGPAAGTPDKTYVWWQFRRFTRLLDELEQVGIHVPVQQAANSAALLDLPETYLTAVCPGRALYGPLETAAPKAHLSLRPAFIALKSRVIQVREVLPDADAGPTGAGGPRRVAVIPIGHADGYSTHFAAGGEVLVRGKKTRVLPSVSLEHTKLDVSDVEGVQVGDEAVLIGRQGEAEISLSQAAQVVGYDGRELLGRFVGRVPYVYMRRGSPVWLTWRFGEMALA